jgi:hypothetical protein
VFQSYSTIQICQTLKPLSWRFFFPDRSTISQYTHENNRRMIRHSLQ